MALWAVAGPATVTHPTITLSFQVDLDSGLSEFAVAQRRLVHGWNEFVTDNTEPVWKKYLDQVRGRTRVSAFIRGAGQEGQTKNSFFKY